MVRMIFTANRLFGLVWFWEFLNRRDSGELKSVKTIIRITGTLVLLCLFLV